mgnify:CR=1 FL=1
MWVIKNNRISIIKIEKEYTDFLRCNIDSKIPLEHTGEDDLSRAFVGIILSNNGIEYVIPLTSPKAKHKKMHNMVDFQKIDNGLYGAINFNNMFPVVSSEDVYQEVNTDLTGITDPNEIHYINLLKNQLTWLNIESNKQIVLRKAQKLYEKYCDGSLNEKIRNRCCNFIELEKHYIDYLDRL